MLAFLDRDIYDNSSRTRTIILLLLFSQEKERRSRPTSFSLSHPLIPFHPSTPPPPPFPSSPSSSPPPFSFLLCPTSQLYTLAVATSIVYFKTPQTRKNQSASFSSFFFSSFYCNEKLKKKTYRNLLPQKINIIFTICQTLLCRVEFGNEECFGFGEGVGEHDVCLFKLGEKLACGCGKEKEKEKRR